MSEKTRTDSTEYAEQIQDAGFERAQEPLSSKRLFRLAAELQDLLTTRRARNKRMAAAASLTHYVE
jgi:hypothetical protein